MILFLRQLRPFLFFSIVILFFACNENHTSKAEKTVTPPSPPERTIVKKDSFEQNQVIQSVSLRTDPSQSFALYLPANYSDSTKFPVIIFFDPHGDGTVPLNLYHELAGQFGFILMGSNSSKNGLSFEQTDLIANQLIHEAATRFSVDEKRIFLCGFSGGAKVALRSGAVNKFISAIVYCGAAIPVQPNHPLKLLGFAGKKDMNYTDVVSFDWNIQNSMFEHYLIEWNGKHEFPTADIFKDAFTFLNSGKIENYPEKKVTITPQQVQREQAAKQHYLQALQTEDIGWWKKEIEMLNKKKENEPMYERLLGFISLACYSYSNNALQQNNLPVAEKVLTIYQLADPENEDCKKFMQELKRRKGQG